MAGGGGSSLFSGFRLLGLYCNHVPHVLRYHRKHREFYLVTSVGKCLHTYNVNRLGIVAISNSVQDDITCLAADRMLTFAAAGSLVLAFAKNKEVVMRYRGHKQEVRLLLPFGDQLISVDGGGLLVVWDVQSGEVYTQLHFEPGAFEVSAMMHPSTYLNKVLLGSCQGPLQLWNLKSSKLLYTFAGWSAGVTVLQQSPAVDVVAVGTATGRIVIHNIRLDETLMAFTQDWGPITSLAFRTDGPPTLAAGSPQGHLALWDLERRQLAAQLRHAHKTAVNASFLHGEPLLITTAADNAIKVWILDQEGGGARLLRNRQGHSAPPSVIRHYDGKNILSAGQDGTLQSFSTVHERLNKNLGHGSLNKKKEQKKKKGLSYEELRLPAVTAFSCAAARRSDWDGIVACHRGRLATTTWSYQRCTMGEHHLRPPPGCGGSGAVATAVDITSCGNFALVGSSCGRVDVYNLQSGLHRGCYGDEQKAHDGAVRGVATDTLNQQTVTAAADGLLKFWRFKTRRLEDQIQLNTAPACMKLHRESGMLAVALDDFTLLAVDVETRRAVRKFAGHLGSTNDMSFSPDGRWLITVGMDCAVRTWDLPSGSLVDCFLVPVAPVGVSMSPTGDFLATSHVDSLGVCLWTNKSLRGPVGLRPLPPDYRPETETLPGAPEAEREETSEEGADEEAYASAEQLGAELVTLSQLPESRWKHLLCLDTIKRRNKAATPPVSGPSAPFFLPTVPGLTPRFSQLQQERQSKVSSCSLPSRGSKFSCALEAGLGEGSFTVPAELLKSFGPSAVSVELAGLSPEGGGASGGLFLAFIRMIESMLASGRDFDLAHAYLSLFLKLHLRSVAQDAVAMEALVRLSSRLEAGWAELRASFNQSLCLLTYAKSALL
ncbi:WD repeat-containing protein 36 [Syngnathus typhle]|uniref:WD repeat-containing protein 36 n=1 Tax=Syngnathus typhle TaxID=161592 RepID=UPI002A69C7D6|nr:WD repeat-containing protein 36 [Syngnathus typhle]